MTTHSQAKAGNQTAITARNPCFCGNQSLLKNHSSNCKQQILNWALTEETITIQGDWAHESELTDALTEEEENDMKLHGLFDETGYQEVSNINAEEEDGFGPPNLSDLGFPNLSQYQKVREQNSDQPNGSA
jgi:hypothetical protein